MSKPLKLDPWYSPLTTEWVRDKMIYLSDQYMRGHICPSPYLHQRIYGEKLDPEKPRLTPCVLNHLRIIWCPAGGINTNDYRHLPMEFRRELYPMLRDFSTKATLQNDEVIRKSLKSSYGLEGPLAELMLWYYTAPPQYRHILEEDAKVLS